MFSIELLFDFLEAPLVFVHRYDFLLVLCYLLSLALVFLCVTCLFSQSFHIQNGSQVKCVETDFILQKGLSQGRIN